MWVLVAVPCWMKASKWKMSVTANMAYNEDENIAASPDNHLKLKNVMFKDEWTSSSLHHLFYTYLHKVTVKSLRITSAHNQLPINQIEFILTFQIVTLPCMSFKLWIAPFVTILQCILKKTFLQVAHCILHFFPSLKKNTCYITHQLQLNFELLKSQVDYEW